MRSESLWLSAALLGVVAAGCGDDDKVSEKEGSLGNVTFAYLCGGAVKNDPYCDPQAQNPTFPVIALGGKFQVGAPGGVEVSAPARIAVIGRSGERIGGYSSIELQAQQPGFTALIGHGPDGPDYIDVQVKPVAQLRMELIEVNVSEGWRLTGTLSTSPDDVDLKLKEGKRKEFYLRAVPLDDTGKELGGAVDGPWAWSTSDATVLEVATTNGAHIGQFRKVGPGKASLSVKLGNVNASIKLEGQVEP